MLKYLDAAQRRFGGERELGVVDLGDDLEQQKQRLDLEDENRGEEESRAAENVGGDRGAAAQERAQRDGGLDGVQLLRKGDERRSVHRTSCGGPREYK